MSNLSSNMVLFLATFFIALFTDQIEDSVFQTVWDRLAASTDFSSVKDGITVFLRIHLSEVPPGLDSAVRTMLLFVVVFVFLFISFCVCW